MHNNKENGKMMSKENEGTTREIDGTRKRVCMWQVQVDPVQVLLFALALCTRLWRLEEPRAIVFDELHYGRHTAMYLKNTFFFDAHPPLGKMLLALGGWVAGWNGEDFSFDQIGTAYPSSVPVWALRALPAIAGSAAVPLVYELLLAAHCSPGTAILGATSVLLDNALVTQSRFAFIDGFFFFFMLSALYSLQNFRQLNSRCAFSPEWWLWLWLLGLSCTAAICTKYIGVMTFALCALILTKDMWNALPDKTLTDGALVRHMLARIGVLVAVPVVLYLGIFSLHLSILYKAGPHDDVMTSAFQASLQGGLGGVTAGQPARVVYGSQVTLRRTYGTAGAGPCWLHSHTHLYPLRYPDGRGSSHQQQVTCYTYKDVNNWWIIKQPGRNSLMVDEPPQPVKHGDVIQLIHGITSRALNSHDVAAPMSPQFQEVSCYIDYNISSPAQNLWTVDIVNRAETGPTWRSILSRVRLVHVNSSLSLRLSGNQLGDWGFHQYEVVAGAGAGAETAAVWNVEEHRYTRSSNEDMEISQEEEEEEVQSLGFFSKFWELQTKMIVSLYDSVSEHRYGSHPISWLTLSTNVAYWMDNQQKCQIHLLPNPVLWLSGSISVVLYLVLLVFYVLRRHRGCYDIPQDIWERFVSDGEVFGGGFLLHLLPYFLADQLLFLHYYLPAYICQLLLLASLMEHLYVLCRLRFLSQHWGTYLVPASLAVPWLACVLQTFRTFVPLTYGAAVGSCPEREDIEKMQWLDAWDFIVKP